MSPIECTYHWRKKDITYNGKITDELREARNNG